MKNARRFCQCPYCGNFISFIQNAGTEVICCGKPMVEITPNSTDAAQEKHVPVAVRKGDILTVTVGSTAHPMTEEHHIDWIIVAEGGKTQRVALANTQEPSADFVVGKDPVTIYAYCNLHGLWEGSL
jgi:superoxide reductase